MITECVQTDIEFEKLKDEWNHLLENSISNNVFLTWEWMFTWWKHYNARKTPFIITARDRDGQLIGVAPLCISKVKVYHLTSLRSLSFIGSGEVCSDYLDFILLSDKSEMILDEMLNYIKSMQKMWDYAFIEDVSERSIFFKFFKEMLEHQKSTYLTFKSQKCPYIELPDCYESYISRLSKNMRYNLKRRTRNLKKKYDVKFLISDSSDDVALLMETLFDLHKKRREVIGDEGGFLKSNLIPFHTEIAALFNKEGKVRLYTLMVDGNPAAMLYGFIYNKKFFYYQAGMDPDYENMSVGMVLMGYCIQDSINNKLQEFDMLRGGEAYKFKWTKTYRNTYNMLLSADSVKGKSYVVLKSISQKTKNNVKKKLMFFKNRIISF